MLAEKELSVPRERVKAAYDKWLYRSVVQDKCYDKAPAVGAYAGCLPSGPLAYPIFMHLTKDDEAVASTPSSRDSFLQQVDRNVLCPTRHRIFDSGPISSRLEGAFVYLCLRCDLKPKTTAILQTMVSDFNSAPTAALLMTRNTPISMTMMVVCELLASPPMLCRRGSTLGAIQETLKDSIVAGRDITAYWSLASSVGPTPLYGSITSAKTLESDLYSSGVFSDTLHLHPNARTDAMFEAAMRPADEDTLYVPGPDELLTMLDLLYNSPVPNTLAILEVFSSLLDSRRNAVWEFDGENWFNDDENSLPAMLASSLPSDIKHPVCLHSSGVFLRRPVAAIWWWLLYQLKKDGRETLMTPAALLCELSQRYKKQEHLALWSVFSHVFVCHFPSAIRIFDIARTKRMPAWLYGLLQETDAMAAYVRSYRTLIQQVVTQPEIVKAAAIRRATLPEQLRTRSLCSVSNLVFYFGNAAYVYATGIDVKPPESRAKRSDSSVLSTGPQ